MDDARKLLDSLMGSHRNSDRKTFMAKKGQGFKEDNICKYHLIGFCPQYEELFHSTKRDLGHCTKVHSEAMKEEFEASPEKERYQADWERKLKAYLEDLVRGADDWVARERRNIADANRMLEEGGPNEVARGEIKKLNDSAAELLAAAENDAEAGNIQESKMKAEKAEDLKKKATEYEDKAKLARIDDVCEVCGSRMESGDVTYARFKHQEGKVHVGYVKIREWLAELRTRVRAYDIRDEKENEAKREARRERSRSRRGDRDRERTKEPKDRDTGGRAAERADRGDRGDRDRGDRGDRDRDRDRDRAAGRHRSGDDSRRPHDDRDDRDRRGDRGGDRGRDHRDDRGGDGDRDRRGRGGGRREYEERRR